MNFSRFRGQNHYQVTAFHLGLLLNHDFFLEFFPYPFQNFHPLIGVGDLPATKKNRTFALSFCARKRLIWRIFT